LWGTVNPLAVPHFRRGGNSSSPSSSTPFL